MHLYSDKTYSIKPDLYLYFSRLPSYSKKRKVRQVLPKKKREFLHLNFQELFGLIQKPPPPTPPPKMFFRLNSKLGEERKHWKVIFQLFSPSHYSVIYEDLQIIHIRVLYQHIHENLQNKLSYVYYYTGWSQPVLHYVL